MAGFEKLGHRTLLHREKSDISRTTLHDILATIDEFKPDVIIYIDHFRDEFPLFPRNVPFVNWIQDLLPELTNHNNRSFVNLDFTYTFSPQWLKGFNDDPAYREHQVQFLPLGINTKIYHPIPETTKDIDVLYISHLPDPSFTFLPFRDADHKYRLTADEIVLIESGVINYEELLLIEMLMQKRLENCLIDDIRKYSYDYNYNTRLVKQVLDTASISHHPDIIDHFKDYCRLHNDIQFCIKTRPIEALLNSNFGVRVYGNHWQEIARFRSISGGIADNGEQLNTLMSRVKICLNNSPGVSFHMRALEILGSGSFMLSRRIKNDACSLSEVFPEHTQTAYFNNEYDIVAQVKYFLENNEERQKRAKNAHKKAVKRFSYESVAKQILDRIITVL